MPREENPILNNPYEEPTWHYATNLQGELDYSRPVKGRRIFTPEVQTIPVRQGQQADLMELNEIASADHGSHIVNLLRREVGAWRQAKYPQTTRITRELLHFWFLNAERDMTQSLFFAQREAIETAIWLNEIAEKSNVGQHILRQLEEARKVSVSSENNLPRIAFKMATGSGKTVVMGALTSYHYFNRAEYRNDVRFADNFLLIAPGITIRDRLGVLRVDTRSGVDAEDYYHVRYLVPEAWRKEMPELNKRLVITNYHAFEPKTLQGNKRSPFDGKIQPDGTKQEATEDYSQVIARLFGNFRPGSRLLVINDEAHHCYLPRQDDQKAEGEDTAEENRRAAVWFSGLVRITQRFKVRSIYDLSATPYYLTGSGYEPYSLFKWVVSDFGLIEAVESGLVKIPFLPTRDDTQHIDLPVLRNLYEHIRDKLPKAGRKTAKARAKADGKKLVEEPPHLPETLQAALKQFYEHYREEYENRRYSAAASGTDQLLFEDSPPVFIVVCNNTSVSKEVYKYLAGYEIPAEEESQPPHTVSGVFELFSNYDPITGQPRGKPPTLLIDSDALENSEQIDEEFKRVFAPEIKRFKEEYSRVHGQGAAERMEDSAILREVVNTVGKRNALGAHVRCVVSVSMLTEGWDANTVTHICGIRKFGSQLLCEQVAGRALRRQSYYLQSYDKNGEPTTDKRRIATWKFPPEYAHIIGVPFKLFKGGKTVPRPPKPTARVFAMPERTRHFEITFPNIEGYRLEYAEGHLVADFSGVENYEIDGSKLPTKTEMASAVSAATEHLSLEDILATREQQIIYRITKDLLRDHFSDDDGNHQFHRFHELCAIVANWYHTKVRVLGKGPEWKKLLYFWNPQPLVAHVARGIKTGKPGEEAIRPILNYYNPTGSSRYVHGQTSRETYPTKHSHVNAVVIDSGWEGRAAKTLDDLTDEGHIVSWVKNAFLGFHIPYTDIKGEQREYFPDFIVRCGNGEPLNLILEISGMRKDKALKKWTVINRWLPAVNRIREQHGWDKWDFLEIANEVELADLRNIFVKFLENPSATKVSSLVWAKRQDYVATHGEITEDFELPERKVENHCRGTAAAC
ncbi:MAG: DEAD/DEAH box helicase family protein [Verrucomicrobiales bacterium]|nr:DEAD/DEAH box helicase family protein [Verrucomicrobiales bacterium]